MHEALLDKLRTSSHPMASKIVAHWGYFSDADRDSVAYLLSFDSETGDMARVKQIRRDAEKRLEEIAKELLQSLRHLERLAYETDKRNVLMESALSRSALKASIQPPPHAPHPSNAPPCVPRMPRPSIL